MSKEKKLGRDELSNRYEIRKGTDGEWGIYMKEFNVRIAVFVGNTHLEREKIRQLIKAQAEPSEAKIDALVGLYVNQIAHSTYRKTWKNKLKIIYNRLKQMLSEYDELRRG